MPIGNRFQVALLMPFAGGRKKPFLRVTFYLFHLPVSSQNDFGPFKSPSEWHLHSLTHFLPFLIAILSTPKTGKPSISPFRFPATLTEGMSIITTCSILTGDSPIHVEWHKDGQLLDLASLNIHRNEMGDLGSSLVFRSVGPSHAGNYTCIAHNRVGEDRFTAPMVVRSMYPSSSSSCSFFLSSISLLTFASTKGLAFIALAYPLGILLPLPLLLLFLPSLHWSGPPACQKDSIWLSRNMKLYLRECELFASCTCRKELSIVGLKSELTHLNGRGGRGGSRRKKERERQIYISKDAKATPVSV